MLIMLLAIGTLIGGVLGVKYWLERRDQKEDQEREASIGRTLREEEAKRRERTRFDYYCYGVQGPDRPDEKPCFQGPDLCEDNRSDALRVLHGAQVGACEREEHVYRFTFACRDDSSHTCYQAHDTREECERAREPSLKTANNLTECVVVKSGD